MQLTERLLQAGFDRVIVLDAASCGVDGAASLILTFAGYEAELPPEDSALAWIHPYYPVSQRAYEAASRIARELSECGVALRDDVRVKPIFARLPGFTQGTNTLSYMDGWGSRFHVQILTSVQPLPATHWLEEAPHMRHCGSCRACVDACPANALENGVFHRERCLRNWQLSGRSIPEELRERMGVRLIGCDVCQAVCPHNAKPMKPASASIPLEFLLSAPKDAALQLRPLIGANLTIPNRVLAQSCILAASAPNDETARLLEGLMQHPSAAVAEHAAWAYRRMTNNGKDVEANEAENVHP